jgi:hypothetical protein
VEDFVTRIFKVKIANFRYANDWHSYEVVAATAEEAIKKAKRQGVRESGWRGGWVVEELYHRGPAV